MTFNRVPMPLLGVEQRFDEDKVRNYDEALV